MRGTDQIGRGRRGATTTMRRATCALFALAMSFRLTGVHAARLGGAATYETTSFKVEYGTDYKIVTTKATAAGMTPKTYVLYKRGTTAPTMHGSTSLSGFQKFEYPVERVAAYPSPAMGYMEQLGLRSKLVLVDAANVHSPCIQYSESRSLITGSTGHWSDTTGIWATDVAAMTPAVEMVLTDEYGTGATGLNGPTGTPMDVEFASSNGGLGMLQRTEQVKFLSLFFDIEADAEAYYNDQVDRWNLQTTAVLQNQARGHIPSGLKCAWVSKIGSTITFSDASYKRELCEAAGLTLHAPTGTYTTTAFHAEVQNVAIIIDETYQSTPSTYTKANLWADFALSDSTAGGLPVLSTSTGRILRLDKHVSDILNGVYNHANPAESLAWFEAPYVHPALVLQDLTRIVYWEGVAGVEPIAAGCPKFFRDMNADENVQVTGGSYDECALWDNARTQKTCLAKELQQRETIEGLYLLAASGVDSIVTVTTFVALAIVAIIAY